MNILSGWALLGLLATTPTTTASLDELLGRLGAEELRKERETCSYKEKSLSEERSDDDELEGSIARVYAITRSPDRIARELLSKEKQGDVSSAFEAEPKETPEQRKEWRSAFHPDEQKRYRFELVKSDEHVAVIRYAPLLPNPKHMKGTVEIDLPAATLRSMKVRPSENPTLVEEMGIEMSFAPTACGVQPTKVKMQGKAGLLFVKKRFRIASTFHDFETR